MKPRMVSAIFLFVIDFYDGDVADFKNYFEEFGTVVSAEVMFNRETNKSRGFGFVVFEAENSVDLVLEDRNHTIDGKSVRWNFIVLV